MNDKHALSKLLPKFLHHMLNVLPSPYSGQDANRATLMYFVVGALDITGLSSELNKKQIIDYIYNLQVLPDKNLPG
jgi:geranylgeranyl transferase type-1 subunit beta